MHRVAARVLEISRGRRGQTLLDQMIVSGSNFATGILLVRGLGLAEFGKFTVAYAVLLLANSVQLSFISSAMITLGSLCATVEERRRLVRGMYGVQLVFCAIVAVVAAAGAWIYVALNRAELAAGAAPAFACAVVAYLMQDWLRRYYFTVGKAGASVGNDAISYIGQLAVLAVLMAMHALSVESAFWAIGITSGVAFAVGAVHERLGTSRVETSAAWRESRGISMHLGIANQLQWLVYQGAMLVGASVAGPQAAGGVRATQNVIGPVNVAYQAMENIVPIRAAEEVRKGGIDRAAAFLLRFGAAGFMVLLVVFTGIALVSGRFLAFFYGHQLRSFGLVLNLQMLYFLLVWPVRQFTFLFRTIKRTAPILMSSMVAAAVSLTLVYPMVRSFGAAGIMIAAVAGQSGNLIYLVFAWVRTRTRAAGLVVEVRAG